MNFLSENLNVVLTIAGLLAAVIGTIVEKLAPENRRITRTVLILLAIVGFAVTAYGVILQERDDDNQKRSIGALIAGAQSPLSQDLDARLERIDAELRAMSATTSPKHETLVPTPPAPAALQYFVQVAADTSADRLNTYALRLQRTYNVTSDVAGVVDMGSGTNRYRLAFGQRLDRATAQKYVAVANSLHLPPPGQSATIQPQPK